MSKPLSLFIIETRFVWLGQAGLTPAGRFILKNEDGSEDYENTHYVVANHQEDAEAFIDRLYENTSFVVSYQITKTSQQKLDGIIRSESLIDAI